MREFNVKSIEFSEVNIFFRYFLNIFLSNLRHETSVCTVNEMFV